MRANSLVSVSLVAIVGCSIGSKPASLVNEVRSGFSDPALPPVDCGADGVPMLMHLSAEGVEVAPDDTALKLGRHVPETTDFAEFEICGTPDERAVLKRVSLIRRMSAGAWTRPLDTLIPENEAHGAALWQAILSGDYSALEISFINSRPAAPSFLLKGWKKPNGKSFLTISAFDNASNDPLKVIDEDTLIHPDFRGYNSVVYGILAEGAARDWKAECKRNTRKKRFLANGIDLTLKYCYTGNHAIYISYDFQELYLSDQNSGESLSLQGNDAILSVLSVNETHHSLLDSFTIAAPSGAYVIEPRKFSWSYKGDRFPKGEKPLVCDRVYECGEDVPEPMR